MHLLGRTLAVLTIASFSTAAHADICLPQNGTPPVSAAGEPVDGAALATFYQASAGACLWNEGDAASLVRALDHLSDQAIDPAPFHREAIARADHVARDLLLTDAALRYARVMTIGAIAPGDVDEDWEFPVADADRTAPLRAALARRDVDGFLASLQPQSPSYRALIGVLARYRALAAVGGWSSLATGPSVHPGESDARIPALRSRLAVEGDLASTPEATDAVLDADTVVGLKHFQARHGMAPDGVLGASTVAAFNVPVEARIGQVAANLERWRWMAQAMPANRIEVNVAAQSLNVFVDGTAQMTMRTVVGDAKHVTPLLVARAGSFLLNPPWNVPYSIIKNEIRPQLVREPDFLEKNNMSWIDGKLVQAPGPKNALGQIKLEVHDRFDVYLHDTPSRGSFSRDRRALSHGCVRMEHPLDLAVDLLSSKPGWSRPELDAAIATGATTRVYLPKAVTVVLSYWTVDTMQDGTSVLRDDVYGRDARLAKKLGRGWMKQPEIISASSDRDTIAVAAAQH